MTVNPYRQRWITVIKQMIMVRGAIWAAGYLAGFIISLGRGDRRVDDRLEELEKEFAAENTKAPL